VHLTRYDDVVRIIGPPSATREIAFERASARVGVQQVFVSQMFPALWSAGLTHGIDPVGVVAQSAHETGWGRFGGAVRAEFCNPAGLKNSPEQQRLFPGVGDGDQPLSHALFSNWFEGALAQVQHLCAYAGQPVIGLVVDPRYETVRRLGRSPLENFSQLGGAWAPNPNYGVLIEDVMHYLQGVS
jgi:hypothetical protein